MPPPNRIFTGTLAIAALTLSGLLQAADDEQAEPIAMVPAPAGAHYVLDGQASRGTELAVITPPDGLTIAPDGPSVDTPGSSAFGAAEAACSGQTVVDQPQYWCAWGRAGPTSSRRQGGAVPDSRPAGISTAP
jgi:hypothetical protein